MGHITISLKIDDSYIGIIYELSPQGFKELIKQDICYKKLKFIPLTEEAHTKDEFYILKDTQGGIFIVEDSWYEGLTELAKLCKKLHKLEKKINNKLSNLI